MAIGAGAAAKYAAAEGAKALGSAVEGVAGPALLYNPDQFERQYRKSIKQQQRALAKQKGGFSPGEYQRYLASGRSPISSADQQNLARIERKANTVQTGGSGMAAQERRDAMDAAMRANQKLASDIRDADIDKRRVDIQRLQHQMLVASNMERARREKALMAYDPSLAPQVAERKGKSDQLDQDQLRLAMELIGGMTS